MRLAIAAAAAILVIIRIALATPENEAVGNKTNLAGSRRYLQLKLLSWLPGDSGALASGILLGGDDDLSPRAVLNFRRAGLSHITAASGFNVVVVAGWVMGVLKKSIGRKNSIYFGIVCIILYVYLAGMTIPVVRAGIMVFFSFIGMIWGRKTDVWWTLGLTTMAMILVKPVWLFEISFQLSVAATAGILFAGLLDGDTTDRGVISALRLNLKTSLAAWVATLPLILHHFGQLSLVAPLANLAVVWVVPPVMEILGAAVAVGIIWDGFGWIVALLAWPWLKLMLLATSWFAAMPGSNLMVAKSGWIWVMGYYVLLVLVMQKIKFNSNK
jgi:competence protein ComEC